MKVFKEDIECIICGQTSNHEVIMSNYIGKSSDLDFKPNVEPLFKFKIRFTICVVISIIFSP